MVGTLAENLYPFQLPVVACAPGVTIYSEPVQKLLLAPRGHVCNWENVRECHYTVSNRLFLDKNFW